MGVALVGSSVMRSAIAPAEKEEVASVERRAIMPETSAYVNKHYQSWMKMLDYNDEGKVKSFLTKLLQLKGKDFNRENVNKLLETEIGGREYLQFSPPAFEGLSRNSRGEKGSAEDLAGRVEKSVGFYASTNSADCAAAFKKYATHPGGFFSVHSNTEFYKANKAALLKGATSTSLMDTLRRVENMSNDEIQKDLFLKLIVDVAVENGYLKRDQDGKYKIVVSNNKKSQDEAERDLEERSVIAATRELFKALPPTIREATYLPIFEGFGLTLPGENNIVSPEGRLQDVFFGCDTAARRQSYENQMPGILNGIFNYNKFIEGEKVSLKTGPIMPQER